MFIACIYQVCIDYTHIMSYNIAEKGQFSNMGVLITWHHQNMYIMYTVKLFKRITGKCKAFFSRFIKSQTWVTSKPS